MKIILNLFFALAILGFSTTSFARNPAAGDDPNAEISNLSEAGTFMEGTNFAGQKKVCKACQNRNDVLLSDKKDIFVPGTTPSSSGTTGDTGTGEGHK